MKLVRVVDGVGEVTSIDDLRKSGVCIRANPPLTTLEAHGLFPLEDTPKPEGDGTEYAVEAAPVLVGGKWQQQWNLRKRPVPKRVSKGAFYRVVRDLPAGVQALFRTYLAGLSADEREDLNNALWISRDGDFIANVQTAMGVTDEQMNNLFRRAGRLRDEV